MRKWPWILGFVLVAISAFYLYSGESAELNAVASQPLEQIPKEIPEIEVVEPPKVLYGINVDTKVVIEDVVKPNDNLSSILSNYDVPLQEIDLLARKAKGSI